MDAKERIIVLTFSFLSIFATYANALDCVSCSHFFHDVVESKGFVDKTLFIKNLTHLYDRLYISAPSRFGKSTIMDMVKNFFEIQVDQTGKPVKVSDSSNYRVFKPLKIFKEKEFFRENFGKYPVIFMSLHHIVCNSTATFLKSFSSSIFKVYSNFYFLENSTKLNAEQKKNFKMYRSPNKVFETSDLEDSLNRLSEYLFAHFKEKCIVLLDEVDAPVHRILDSSKNTRYDSIMHTLQMFFANTFKFNSFIRRGFLTGQVRLADYLFYQANNIAHMPYDGSEEIATYYGFTESDVKSLAIKFQGKKSELKDLKTWYSGYKVRDSDLTLYNIHSVLRALNEGKLGSYWEEPHHLGSLKHMLFYEHAGALMMDSFDKPVQIIVQKTVTFNDIKTVQEITDMNIIDDSIDEKAIDIFLQFLLDSGYYTIQEKFDSNVKIIIPNYEVRVALEKALYYSWLLKYGIKRKSELAVLKAVNKLGGLKSEYLNFLKSLKGLFADAHDYPVNSVEFKGLLYHILNMKTKMFIKNSYVTAGGKEIGILIVREDSPKGADGNVKKTGFLIDMNYCTRKSGHDALQRVIRAQGVDRDVFSEENLKSLGPVETKVYIGIRCWERLDKCEICYLYNNTNIKNEIRVSIR